MLCGDPWTGQPSSQQLTLSWQSCNMHHNPVWLFDCMPMVVALSCSCVTHLTCVTCIAPREEVASCSERAYAQLTLSDAQAMLKLNNEQEAAAYATEVCVWCVACRASAKDNM